MTEKLGVRASPVSLRFVIEHDNPCLVLVEPRKTDITEKLLTGN